MARAEYSVRDCANKRNRLVRIAAETPVSIARRVDRSMAKSLAFAGPSSEQEQPERSGLFLRGTASPPTELFGVKASDPLTMLIALLVLSAAAAIAAYLPARRASRRVPNPPWTPPVANAAAVSRLRTPIDPPARRSRLSMIFIAAAVRWPPLLPARPHEPRCRPPQVP